MEDRGRFDRKGKTMLYERGRLVLSSVAASDVMPWPREVRQGLTVHMYIKTKRDLEACST